MRRGGRERNAERDMRSAAVALNREGRRLRERGEISAAIAKHQEALRLKSDAGASFQVALTANFESRIPGNNPCTLPL